MFFFSSYEKDAEIERLKNLLAESEERRLVLAGDKAQLQEELERTKELLASARAAKENDCLRGEYCGHCKYSVLIKSRCREKCVCTYGTCSHFEKEVSHEPD